MSTQPDSGARRADTTPMFTAGGRDRPVPQHTDDHGDARTEVIGVPPERRDDRDLRSRQQERFGGIKWGSAFFGWLTAIGTTVLLSALVTSIGGAVGLSSLGDPAQAAQNPDAASTAAVVGAIVAAVILLVAYFCGGYVAGRMARFNGAKQGVAVWVWTVVITVAVAILVVVGVARFDVLGSIGGLPQLPVDGSTVSIAAVIGAVVALAVSLVGAVLGGLAGMRFHRRVDRVDPPAAGARER